MLAQYHRGRLLYRRRGQVIRATCCLHQLNISSATVRMQLLYIVAQYRRGWLLYRRRGNILRATCCLHRLTMSSATARTQLLNSYR